MEMTGIIKWFNTQQGHGFIIPTDRAATNGKDVFLHHKNCVGDNGHFINFEEGERVTFELTDRGRGPLAVNVRKCVGRRFAPNGSV